MRNYFQVEKTDEGIFISEGKGNDAPADYDWTKDWEDFEEIETEEALFARIKELLKKN